MARFERYIGIDYSGAGRPTEGLAGIRVYEAGTAGEPRQVRMVPERPRRHWHRAGLANWLRDRLQESLCLVGVDHSFSFPMSYMTRYQLTSWDDFLRDFDGHWPTRTASVEDLRRGNARTGSTDEMRLCETWTSSAKSNFQFDVQGSVAKSAHAGIPWIAWLRAELGPRVHVWPYDGEAPPPGVSVLAECYPSIFRRRYPREERTVDEQDAMATARWLQRVDRNGSLAAYFHPPLTQPERALLSIEGWILGIW